MGQAPLQNPAGAPSGAPGRLLTPKQLATRLGVGVVTVRRMLKAQKLPFVKVGERVRFNYDDVYRSLPTHKPSRDD